MIEKPYHLFWRMNNNVHHSTHVDHQELRNAAEPLKCNCYFYQQETKGWFQLAGISFTEALWNRLPVFKGVLPETVPEEYPMRVLLLE